MLNVKVKRESSKKKSKEDMVITHNMKYSGGAYVAISLYTIRLMI